MESIWDLSHPEFNKDKPREAEQDCSGIMHMLENNTHASAKQNQSNFQYE